MLRAIKCAHALSSCSFLKMWPYAVDLQKNINKCLINAPTMNFLSKFYKIVF